MKSLGESLLGALVLTLLYVALAWLLLGCEVLEAPTLPTDWTCETGGCAAPEGAS